MTRYVALIATLLLSIAGFAQSPAPQQPVVVQATQTFSLTANALALTGSKQTVAAAVVGGTFAITPKLSLRQENIIAGGNAMNGYYGGVQYELPALSRKLNSVSVFDATQLHMYLTASFGVDHVGAAQHYSELFGGGINYGSGKATVNLVELRGMRAPGFAVGVVPLVSSGVKFSF